MEGHADYAFESFVNSERCKTYAATVTLSGVFESFVNLENMPI